MHAFKDSGYVARPNAAIISVFNTTGNSNQMAFCLCLDKVEYNNNKKNKLQSNKQFAKE